MGYTIAEKILLSHSAVDSVEPGQVLMVRCDVVLANDVTGPVAFRQMEKMGASEVFDRSKIVMVADHFAPAKDERSAILIKRLKDWSLAHGVTYYDQGRGGIEHTLIVEEGWVYPGVVIAGGDSHTCTHGALGAFSTGLGSTDIAHCLVFGEFWQAVPGTIQVTVTGAKGRFVTGKDVILSVLAQIGAGGGTGNALEFVGPGAEALSIDERLAVANLAIEAGAETGIFPADDKTAAYLESRVDKKWEPLRSDPDASYSRKLTIDLDITGPLVAKPHNPENVAPVSEVAGTPIHQVVVGNCSNGTMTDLRQATQMVQGKRIHEQTRMIVIPATQKIYREAIEEGLVDILVEAGATVSTPTCGPCFGGHTGALAPGENSITTTNRNFKGRAGSPQASVYLANAYVAAAAAVAGEIVDPAEVTAGTGGAKVAAP